MTIGEKIRYFRNLRGYTQAELGEKLNLQADRIRQYENDVRTPKTDLLQKIADALDVDVEALSDINIQNATDIMHVLFELEDQHTIDTKKHELERETKVFASLCGINYQGTDAITQFLPNSIPLVDAVDVNSFPEETYTELEAALWTNKINQLERDAEKFFTLNANAGYTFANSSAGSSSKTDTVDFGTGMTFADTGLSASAGVSIPTTSEDHNPIFTFGISIDPNAFRQAKITSQIEKLEAEQEAISIQSARNNYQTAVTTQAAELADIQWNKSSNTETYNLYKSLAADLQTWYKRGITTESEWRSAEVNKEKYRIQLLLNDIDLIIYNNETLLLFTRDQEFVSDKEGAMENEN